MSIIRILKLRCDDCGREAQGNDPRYDARSLRSFLRGLGWMTYGRNGQGVEELCPDCVRKRVTFSDEPN